MTAPMTAAKTALKTTAAALCLLALWPRVAPAEGPAPRLIAAAPPTAFVVPSQSPPTGAAPDDGSTRHVVLFAGRTVEFAVPRGWTVKQVPLPGEIRVLAGPGDVPDDPRRLERGISIAYHRGEARPDAAPDKAGPDAAHDAQLDAQLDAELRVRMFRSVSAELIPRGVPQAAQVGGYAALKQNLDCTAPGDDATPRRATYVVVQTPWGVLEALGVTRLYDEDRVQAALKQALASLRFSPPTMQRSPSAPGIADAEAVLGSWKGRHQTLHFTPEGRVRLDLDAVTTLTAENAGIARPIPGRLEGSFTAQDDILSVTWDDGSQLNYRWRVQGHDLLLMDHTGQASRQARLFDAPRRSGGF